MLLFDIFHNLTLKTTLRGEITYSGHDTERIKTKSSSLDAWRNPVLTPKLPSNPSHHEHGKLFCMFKDFFKGLFPFQNEPLPKQRFYFSSNSSICHTWASSITQNRDSQLSFGCLHSTSSCASCRLVDRSQLSIAFCLRMGETTPFESVRVCSIGNLHNSVVTLAKSTKVWSHSGEENQKVPDVFTFLCFRTF